MSDKKPKRLGRNSRLFLLDLSLVNMILGVIFYLHPSFVIGLWPWQVKELAVRFLGAIFLAITVGCWSALRAKLWQRAKVLPLVGAVFFGITGIVTLANAASQNSFTITTWAWMIYFLAASLGLFLILHQYGWYRRPQDLLPQDSPWKLANAFFRAQTVVVGVFGFFMLFIPDLAQEEFWPWKVAIPTLQTFAALFLATCLATGWASQQMDRGRIRVLLPLDAIFPALALLAVGVHWNVIMNESPSGLVTAVWVFLYAFVAAGSAYLYFASKPKL